MTLSRNLLAGLINSVWSAFIGLAVIPFYLKYLGVEAYGLIGFFVTTQAVLSLLDMGMAPTINREVARCSAYGSLKDAGKLLHTLAIVYWSMAVMIAVVILMLSPLISEYWLQSKQIPSQTISHALILMGLVVACRWPIGLYQGAVIGAQRLAVSSVINMIMVTISSLGAVIVLAFISPTIEAFFIWQACLGVIYTMVMRSAAWRIVGKDEQLFFDFEKLKSIWRFTAGLSGIALSATILSQQDKIILSKILSLDEFGLYMLATVVVNGLYFLIMPVYNVMYPRLSELVVNGDLEKIVETYRNGTRLFTSLFLPVAMVVVFYSRDIVFLWTGNPDIAVRIAPVISLLAFGTALHGVMFFPYALQLSYGNSKIPLICNVVLMVVSVPLTFILSMKYGLLGGGLTWFFLHSFYMFFGTWLTHKNFLKDIRSKWILHDVMFPLSISVVVGAIGYYTYTVNDIGYSLWMKLSWGALMALMASLLSILSMPQSFRVLVLRRIGWNTK